MPAAIVASLLLIPAVPARAASQQFVTDDAAIVERRACQMEAWHGSIESWIQPACQFIPRLEFTIGVGFLANKGRPQREVAAGGQVPAPRPRGA